MLTGTGGSVSFTQLTSDPVEVWATPGGRFSSGAGTYMLTLTGTNSAAIGSDKGNIAVTAVPEPEPATLALLLLSGMAAVGSLVRRRNA